MTPKRHRLRRVLKWTGLGVCVLIVAVCLMGTRWVVYVDRGQLEFSVGAGIVGFGWGRFDVGSGNWMITSLYSESAFRALGLLSWPRVLVSEWYLGLDLPFWWLLLLMGIPTAYLWWRDRRSPPGHCPDCNYNLTGNLSGICPECGMKGP